MRRLAAFIQAASLLPVSVPVYLGMQAVYAAVERSLSEDPLGWVAPLRYALIAESMPVAV